MTAAAQLISEARSYAQGMVTAAEAAMGDAIGAVSWAREPSVGFVSIGLPDKPASGKDFVLPSFPDIGLELPDDPGTAPVYQNISPVVPGTAPRFSATAPSFSLPSKPSELSPFYETLPSIDLAAEFPDAPEIIQPLAPTFVDHAIPVKPTTVLPSFSGTRPDAPADMTTDLAVEMEDAYRTAAPQFINMAAGYVDAELLKINPQYHAQLARIETQLTKYLDGGTGLKPEIEEAIYNRARARNEVEAKKVQDSVFADTAARGFTLPGGAMVSAMARARQDAANNANKTSNEIAIAQAEMEQKNLQFAVTTSAGLRTAAMSAALSYLQNIVSLNGQAMEYAKGVVNAMVETYNAVVRVYTAKLEGYKTEAQVFQALLQAALAGIEVYKAEIQALQALTQVDQAKVNVYRARIDVLTALTGMYKTQVDAVVSKASLERLRVDVFQAQVQAYGTQVQAKNAEWQGYTAQIAGQEAEAKVFSTRAQAYSAEVAGYKAQIDAKAVEVQAISTTNDARAKQYTAAWDAYKVTAQAKGEVARTKLENQRQQVLAFQAETQAAVANAQIGMEYYKAVGNIAVEGGKLDVQSMIADAEAKTNYIKILSTLHQANATVHANLAGAAMAGMNALAAETSTT